MSVSDVTKDIGAVWNRLFDHKAFLTGEIQFTSREYEQKRSDAEVEDLFSLLETVTDVKDSQIPRLKKSADYLSQVNDKLAQTTVVCDAILASELNYQQDETLTKNREERQADFKQYINDLTIKLKEVDGDIDNKRTEVVNYFAEQEAKLRTSLIKF